MVTPGVVAKPHARSNAGIFYMRSPVHAAADTLQWGSSMMYDSIKNFQTQFAFVPVVANKEKLQVASSFIVLGMGGSGHTADVMKMMYPHLDLTLHRDYGLPEISPEKMASTMVIASSYSGSTEEILDGFEKAVAARANVIAISTGGKLLLRAQKLGIPYIQLPSTGIQPRMSLGYQAKALAALMCTASEQGELFSLAERLDPSAWEKAGMMLAKKLKNKIPVIYVSRRNAALGNLWKIIFNETAKIPAFYNVLPELNHNEMNGFDVSDSTKLISKRFRFVFIKDSVDTEKIQKRFDMLETLYKARGLKVEKKPLKKGLRWEQIFSSFLLASWSALYLGQLYGKEVEQVPMVEEFKRLIADTKI